MVQGGNPPLRPDQALNVALSGAGSGPAPQSQIFIGRLVVVFGTGAGTGIFFYNGSPARGNPPILAITTASTDPYGNTVTASAITDAGMPFLIYSAAPAAGDLLMSVAGAAGSDAFGNSWPAGLASFALNEYANLAGAILSWQNITSPMHTLPSVSGTGGAATGAEVVLGSGGATGGSVESSWSVQDSTFNSSASSTITGTAGQYLLLPVAGGTPATTALVEIHGTMALENEAAPAATAGWAEPYAATGQLQYVDTGGGVYSTGEARLLSTVSQLVNSVAPATVNRLSSGTLAFSVNADQSYLFRAYIVYSTTVNAGSPVFAFASNVGFGSPNTSIVKFFQGGAVTSSAGGSTASYTGPVLAAASFGILELEAMVNFSAAGFFSLTAACTVAADTFTIVGGYMTSRPITN